MSRRALALAAAACALGLGVRLVLLVQPIGGDPGIYAYVAGRVLEGDLPYRDVFEQKPPAILYTYAAAFAVAGRSMRAVQVADFMAWAATVAALGVLAHRLRRDPAITTLTIALAALFVNPTLQSSFKQVGQTETFLAAWATLSIALALGSGLVAAALAGVCVSIAVLHKYNATIYLLVAVGALFANSSERWPIRRAMALAAGFTAPLAAVLLYFWFRGGLAEFYEATIRYNAEYTTGTYTSIAAFVKRTLVVTWRFATMNFLWTAGGAGTLLLSWEAVRGDRRAAVAVAFVAAAYVAILANAKFYPQYFLQILPPLALTSACFLVAAWRATWQAGRRAAGFALLALAAIHLARHTDVGRLSADIVAAGRHAIGETDTETYFARFETTGVTRFSLLADYRVARRIAETTQRDDPIYIYGGEPLVLFLANRRSPSRFVWNDPFVAGAYRTRFTHADLVRELEARPPAYFIVLRRDANMIDPVESIEHYRRSPELQAFVAERFDELGWFEDFLLFKRR